MSFKRVVLGGIDTQAPATGIKGLDVCDCVRLSNVLSSSPRTSGAFETVEEGAALSFGV